MSACFEACPPVCCCRCVPDTKVTYIHEPKHRTCPVNRPELFQPLADRKLPRPCLPDCCSSVSSLPPYEEKRCLNPALTCNQVKVLLRNVIRERYDTIVKNIHSFDPLGIGKIPRRHLKMILDFNCFPLTWDQFNAIIPECRLDSSGRLYYDEFLEEFTGYLTRYGPRENYIRMAVCCDKNSQELEKIIVESMRLNLKNLMRQLMQNSSDLHGHIQKYKFKMTLDNLALRLSPKQFDWFWSRLDPYDSGTICWDDALYKLGLEEILKHPKLLPNRTMEQSLCWPEKIYINCHAIEGLVRNRERANIDNYLDETRNFTFREMLDRFKQVLKRPNIESLLTSAFKKFDVRNTNYIRWKDAHCIFNQFVMPMDDHLFEMIMKAVAPKGSTKLEFNWRLLLDQNCGLSQNDRLHDRESRPCKDSLCYIYPHDRAP